MCSYDIRPKWSKGICEAEMCVRRFRSVSVSFTKNLRTHCYWKAYITPETDAKCQNLAISLFVIHCDLSLYCNKTLMWLPLNYVNCTRNYFGAIDFPDVLLT